MTNQEALNKREDRTFARLKFGDLMAAIIALVNELRTDHGTYKAAVDTFQAAMKYMALTAAGLAIGVGSKKKLLIANTVVFLNNGEFKSKTTAEVDFTATTHDIAPDGAAVKEAVYLLSLQADLTPVVTKGATATGAGQAVIPDCPANQTPIGHARIAVAAGATPFDATTDDLDAAHLTVVYTDVAFLAGKIGASPAAITAAAVPTLD